MKLNYNIVIGMATLLLMMTSSIAVSGALYSPHGINHKPSSLDNNVEWDGLYHNSRDPYYRNPGWGTQLTGAVPVGTDVTMRFRTYKGDVESVQLKYWDNVNGVDHFVDMSVVKSDDTYDYWECTLTSPTSPADWYYAFLIKDGTSSAWYNDDVVRSQFEDTRTYQTGGVGIPNSFHEGSGDYALVFYAPDFKTPDWHKKSVGYQIFIDRFFNGNTSNDPIGDGTKANSDVIWQPWDANGNGVYDDTSSYSEAGIYVDKKDWNDQPGIWSYYGGDMQGVMQKVDYLKSLGVDFIWFNPFSESTDNHGYSVVDYRTLDSYYGILPGRVDGVPQNDVNASMKFFDLFVQKLHEAGIKVIYDTVINHNSASSVYFQRFEGNGVAAQARATGFDVPDQYPNIVGAYENPVTSPYAPFYHFTGGDLENNLYDSWFGFDTIPTVYYVKNGAQTGALQEFVTGPNNIFDFWLNHGVDGFRLDVPEIYQDASQPYAQSRMVNEAIRTTVKAHDPNAPIIGEIWERATKHLAGNMMDGTQNMPFRFNILDWMLGNYDDKTISELLTNIQENYPPQAFYSLWVNLGNHDRTRVLSVLDGNMDELKAVSTLQFGYPGVPVVWYGDEIGTLGIGDPGTRQTFKWDKIEGTTANASSLSLLAHYQAISKIKKNYPVMEQGDFHMANVTTQGVIGFHRSLTGVDQTDALIVANRDASPKRVVINVENTTLTNGMILADLLHGNTTIKVENGKLIFDIPAHGYGIYMSGISNIYNGSNSNTDTSKGAIGELVFITFGFSFIAMGILKSYRKSKQL